MCPVVPQPTAMLALIFPLLCNQHEYECFTLITSLPYATQILFGAVGIVLGVFVIRCQLRWEVTDSSGFIQADTWTVRMISYWLGYSDSLRFLPWIPYFSSAMKYEDRWSVSALPSQMWQECRQNVILCSGTFH